MALYIDGRKVSFQEWWNHQHAVFVEQLKEQEKKVATDPFYAWTRTNLGIGLEWWMIIAIIIVVLILWMWLS